jgi:toxin-antitoxin system PIN domain toxin
VASPIDLLDVGVWLAFNVAGHLHHTRARRYWSDEAATQVAFCRVTVLGFLRLSTNRAAMNGAPLNVPEAWHDYLAFRRLPEVTLLSEPEQCEAILAGWATAGLFTGNHWTDAYLAAFAAAGGCRLVTFDRDFRRFAGLNLLLLEE